MSLPQAKIAVALVLSVWLSHQLAGQPPLSQAARHDRESGSFYLKNYGSDVYSAAPQNWGVIQDQYGNMVFANGDGVVFYNGRSWSLVETPTKSVIRSLAMRNDGRIFVGALDDFGYIVRNGVSSPRYVSLLDKLSPELRTMGNIWSTHVIEREVYFESETGLYVWNDERFKFYPWLDPNGFHKSFVWRNKLYISEPTSGLLLFDNTKFTIAPGGEAFKDIRIYAAMPLDDDIVLGTKYDGLYRYNGTRASIFSSEASHYVKQNEVYAGVGLPGKQIAVGTKYGGVVILNENGTISSMIRKEDGIAANGVRGMFTDRKNDLWLALEEGISHVEVANNISLFDERAGLETAVNDICRFEGNIYVACVEGTFVLDPAHLPEKRARFRRIKLPDEVTCWTFQIIGDRLLVSTNIGVFQIRNEQVTQLTHQPAFAINRFLGDTNRIIVAEDHRLSSLRFKDGQWTRAAGVDSISFDNMKFNETIPGKLWIYTFSQGATLVSFTDENGGVDYDRPRIRHYGPTDGLPQGFIKVNSVGGYESFRVGTEGHMLRFNYRKDRFEEDSLFSSRFGFDSLRVYPVTNEDHEGAFLAKTKRDEEPKEVFIVERTNGAYVHQTFDRSRIFGQVGVMTYWDVADSSAWHVGAEFIVRQHLIEASNTESDFSSYLMRVIAGSDSILVDDTGPLVKESTFPADLSSFRFEFTSNNHVAEEANLFQYKLDGFDKDWSAWSSENIKEYSSLWEGEYRFLVRSKDYSGRISRTQAFGFSVLPPWYRSALAYAMYFVAFVFMVWMLIKWRSRQLERDKVALQDEITRQTTEIRQQNDQLAKQSEELAINAKQLKELDTLKSNFFVNISHEFRTPLSLIIGPLEKFISDNDSVTQGDLQRMHRSATRLQQLINQLLDLAKLESGTLKIIEQRADLLYLLRVITASFESVADTKAIRYEVQMPAGAYEASFDKDKIETIFYNLLSNAFKFTPEGGRIDFSVTISGDATPEITIIVQDTGPGIPPDAINHIFDRFYQADSSSSRAFEGSGIGLSLVREIVVLLKGHVTVESELGEGTAFTVRLPMSGIFKVHDAQVEPAETSHSLPQATDDRSAIIASDHGEDGNLDPAPLILVVEDNRDLREYLIENLRSEFRIETAEEGRTGLDKALSLIPDLILSDMMMPVMDGFTLCSRIRGDERVSHIPFVLLTARATIESKLEGLELGADDYVTKPFNMKELIARIRSLLDQRTRLRRSYSRELRVEPKSVSVTSVDEKFMIRALEIVETHLSDQQFSVERFAEEMGMSRKNLLRKIKAMTDQSVNEFIRNFRLKRAHQLIQGRSGAVGEIAVAVGFNNLSYFSKCFKELYGVQPGEMLGRAMTSAS